ncbi:MAG TPA: metallophosphoesterase [Candidatus Nanoarchaeia archaeon]|nr:metallophosphoesterase [Candidatus Nanoarchaeia archaeon]
MKSRRRLFVRIFLVALMFGLAAAVLRGYKISQANKAPKHTVTNIDQPSDPVIMAAGDIACPASLVVAPPTGECRMSQTADIISVAKPTAVLTLGDNQYEAGSLADFNTVYQPTWGAFKGITHPSIGNHEYDSKGNAEGYFDYFGAAAGQRGQGYYSFDIGTWHLVALNSNCDLVSCNAGQAQEKWLRDDLSLNAAKCTLVYFHHPRFSSGSEHGNDQAVAPLWQAMYDNNVDLVLNGHEHDYERFAPQNPKGQVDNDKGIREIVVGTGGRSLYPFKGKPFATTEARYSGGYGVLKLVLHDSSYDWQFIGEAGSSFSDSGSTSCH